MRDIFKVRKCPSNLDLGTHKHIGANDGRWPSQSKTTILLNLIQIGTLSNSQFFLLHGLFKPASLFTEKTLPNAAFDTASTNYDNFFGRQKECTKEFLISFYFYTGIQVLYLAIVTLMRPPEWLQHLILPQLWMYAPGFIIGQERIYTRYTSI